ncbi:MAG TPA: hypothetical protein VN903_10645 [Polyangia bacterium]|nr:hypothetical protein [Polyangia bacterium]
MTFQPGNKLAVGNTNGGRVRGDMLTRALTSQIQEIVRDKDGDLVVARAKLAKIIDKLIALGIEGNMEAIKFIWDRLEGPVKNVTELKNADGEVLQIELIRRVIVDPAMKTIEGEKMAPTTEVAEAEVD